MKTISLCFNAHQPFRLKTYRFFDMGRDHAYLDDTRNRANMQQIAMECYIPANKMLLELIKKHKGEFKVSFCLSGFFVEQMHAYTPELLRSFRELADSGCVEFIGATYSNSLSSLVSPDEFRREVAIHSDMMKKEFGQKPTAFMNTGLLYSDKIGKMVADMGFKSMVTEGAKHILGWKSPDFVYADAESQKLRLMLRNYRLSNDIAFRFSDSRWCEYPLTSDKFIQWIEKDDGDVINLVMDYEALGCRQSEKTGIFDFFSTLTKLALDGGKINFATVSENAAAHQPIGVLYVNHEVTWADEERDISAWLGNELQNEAFNKLYSQMETVHSLNDPDFTYVWHFLSNADNFYWMATKWFTDRGGVNDTNPYNSSYEAFINYMNVVSDFINELHRRSARKGIEANAVPCQTL